MKRTTAAGGSGKEYDDEAAVVEVGPLCGALSRFESWTRNPASTPNCDRGAHVALPEHAYQNPITRVVAAAILYHAGGQHAGTL